MANMSNDIILFTYDNPLNAHHFTTQSHVYDAKHKTISFDIIEEHESSEISFNKIELDNNTKVFSYNKRSKKYTPMIIKNLVKQAQDNHFLIAGVEGVLYKDTLLVEQVHLAVVKN